MGRISGEEFERLGLAERHELLRRRLTRRGLLRGAGAAALGLGAGPALLTRADAAAVPATTARWLAYGDDPARSMHVRWQVAGPVTNPLVRVGTGADRHDVPAELEVLRTVLGTGRVVEQYFVGADLTGLRPATQYGYEVAHDGAVSTSSTFSTAALPGDRTPFTFTAFADHSTRRPSASMVDRVVAERPAFHLLAGDIAYADASGRGRATDDYEPTRWDRYFEQVDAAARSVPWMVTVGNHELEAVYGDHGYGGFTKRFRLPRNGPAICPATYSFVHGTVGVVTFDANDLSDELPAAKGYTGGSQLVWLRERLARLRADDRVEWLVLVLHQCAYSTSTTHGSDAGVRAAVSALADTYRVDLVVNGHNHVYERTDPLRGGRSTPAPPGATVTPATDGTTYLTVGGGGMGLTAFGAPDSTLATARDDRPFRAVLIGPDGSHGTEQVGWSRTRFTGHSVLAVDVQPSTARTQATLGLRVLDANGQVIDRLTLRQPASSWLGEHAIPAAVAGGAVLLAGAGTACALHRRRDARAQAPTQGPDGAQSGADGPAGTDDAVPAEPVRPE